MKTIKFGENKDYYEYELVSELPNITEPYRVYIDDTTAMGTNVSIVGKVTILKHVSIRDDVSISSRIKIGNGVMIGSGTSITHGVTIEDNCVIGDNVVIDDYAIIKEGSVIRDDAHIGESVILGSRVHVGVGAKIEYGSILGEGVEIEERHIVDFALGFDTLCKYSITGFHEASTGEYYMCIADQTFLFNSNMPTNEILEELNEYSCTRVLRAIDYVIDILEGHHTRHDTI